MVKGYYRELVDLLRAAGCRFVRAGKGDHEIWFSPITEIHFTVDHGCKSRHRQCCVEAGRLAQAVLKRSEAGAPSRRPRPLSPNAGCRPCSGEVASPGPVSRACLRRAPEGVAKGPRLDGVFGPMNQALAV
ncbi:type II toxin-antitoxin system HicA family toxin [Paracoccus sp. S3-43]|uniref:type II toxin-antitoxin system HicA family toxin n=1 Tax=Paracoccus sp. S3-43 TaxID=3030011 RepID=UPI0031834D6A